MGFERGVYWERGVSDERGVEGRGGGGLRTSEVTGDVITFCAGGAAVFPLAGETEVVGALPTDVVVAEVVIERLWVREYERTV